MVKKSKQDIINSASELFSEFGFWGVSMESIAKKLNLTKPAIYHHFKNKRELYFKAVDSSFEGLMNEIKMIFANKTKEPKKRLLEISQVYLEFGLKQKSFAKITTHGSFDRRDATIPEYLIKLKNKMIEVFESTIGELYKERVLTEKDKTREDAVLLVGAIDGIMMNACLSGKKEKIGEQLKKIISMILKVD